MEATGKCKWKRLVFFPHRCRASRCPENTESAEPELHAFCKCSDSAVPYGVVLLSKMPWT
jgi:hypothetical protein